MSNNYPTIEIGNNIYCKWCGGHIVPPSAFNIKDQLIKMHENDCLFGDLFSNKNKITIEGLEEGAYDDYIKNYLEVQTKLKKFRESRNQDESISRPKQDIIKTIADTSIDFLPRQLLTRTIIAYDDNGWQDNKRVRDRIRKQLKGLEDKGLLVLKIKLQPNNRTNSYRSFVVMDLEELRKLNELFQV